MAHATTPSSELRFDVEGMTCGHCRKAITDEVAQVEGVTGVDVDLDDALVTVRGEELVEQVVREAIAMAGYQAQAR